MTETTNTQKVESGLSKKTVLLYKVQNPAKFQTKFGHLNLDLIPDENQKFAGVKDMEAFVNYAQAQIDGDKSKQELGASDAVYTPNVGIPQETASDAGGVVTTTEAPVSEVKVGTGTNA